MRIGSAGAAALAVILLAGSGNGGDGEEERGCRWSDRWTPDVDAFRSSSDVTHPVKIEHVAPKWPIDRGGHRGDPGRPVIEALVDETGKVVDVHVLEGSSWTPAWPEFDQALVDAVWKWGYRPGMIGDRAVPVCLTATITIDWRSGSE